MSTPQQLLELDDESQCKQTCEHGSRCVLPANHLPQTKHETEHGCICYSDITHAQIDARRQRKP